MQTIPAFEHEGRRRTFPGLPGRVVFIALTGFLVLLLCVVYAGWWWSSDASGIPPDVERALIDNAVASLATGDVPVGAVIVYDGRIIGAGHNVVNADTNAAGHAEIEAMTSAMRNVGPERFKALDRASVTLYSTFEPCPMCRGVILEYGIRNVRFLKGKPPTYTFGQDIRTILYYLRRRQAGRPELQDSLFRLHPAYDASKED